MVSIRKAKQGFQVRRRGGADQAGLLPIPASLSQGDKEKLGLMVMAGLCVGMLALMGVFSSSSFGGSGGAMDPNSSLGSGPMARFRKPHPNLVIESDGDEMNNGEGVGNNSPPAQQERKKKATQMNNDRLNAVALDVQKTLNCEKLFDDSTKVTDGRGALMEEKYENPERRRLAEAVAQHGDDGGFAASGKSGHLKNQGEVPETDDDKVDAEEEKWGREAIGKGDRVTGLDDKLSGDFRDNGKLFGDDVMQDGFGYNPQTWTAQHLFCLAAMETPPPEVVKQFACEASTHKRRPLLDLWTAARSQIPDERLLIKFLDLAREQKSRMILERNYNLWAPSMDKGMTYVINTLNKEQREILLSLKTSLVGESKLFVDVGSGMGLTSLAVMHMYPMTKIVSIEPASPNWLLQELNLRCNLSKKELSQIKVVLAGVGPNDEAEDNMMAKLMWRPTSTTSTRSWTPADEFGPDDIELLVRLRKLKSILAEADVYRSTPNMMDVLNLDCQGCEYNLVPALTEDEFDSIPNVIGGVHWGYIPPSKLPSSDRGRRTHERLCQHENIAKATKECCSFLNSPVKSSVPGEVLYREKGDDKPAESVTVSDIIQDGLCLDFEQWAKDHYVYDVQEDFGWFELSSQA